MHILNLVRCNHLTNCSILCSKDSSIVYEALMLYQSKPCAIISVTTGAGVLTILLYYAKSGRLVSVHFQAVKREGEC